MVWLEQCQWAVSLIGSEFDLRIARALLGVDGDIHVGFITCRGGVTHTLLRAKEFLSLDNGTAVDEAAKRITDFINGALYVQDSERSLLRTNAVYKRDGSEWGGGIAYASAHLKGGARVFAIAEGSVSPPHIRWIECAMADEAIADVLTYLRTENPDWFDLYKVYETMNIKGERKKHPNAAKWPPLAQINRFSLSAQSARHSKSWNEAYINSNPMGVDEAREFIRSAAQAWLTWRCTAQSASAT